MLMLKLIGGAISPVIIFGVLLFVPAGTFAWWQAWVFLAVVLACAAGTMVWVFANNEALLNERYGSPLQKGQPLADKIVANIFVLSFFAVILLIPLDVFHLHVFAAPPPIVAFAGLLLFVGGWLLIAAAMRENTFAAPVVKHQTERHQETIKTGVYAIVRHPMYTSLLLLTPGMSIWLGSYAAALLSIVPIVLVAVRIVFEEQFLRRELPGYEDYTHQVRYRMVPFVW
jgi:protein-S-isoprenylcysteine O-methyltransferase Ste14